MSRSTSSIVSSCAHALPCDEKALESVALPTQPAINTSRRVKPIVPGPPSHARRVRHSKDALTAARGAREHASGSFLDERVHNRWGDFATASRVPSTSSEPHTNAFYSRQFRDYTSAFAE